MAVLEEGLYTYLTTYAGLVSLISTRVYIQAMPQGVTLPCMTFQRVSTPRSHTHDTGGAGNDLASPRFQFDAWATTQKSAKAIADQIRAALNGKKGTIATGVSINAALVNDEVPSYESDTKLFRVRSDYVIWHND
jgi:hypothetical protein